MFGGITPTIRIVGAAFIGLVVAVSMVVLEVEQPWLGARLAWDARAGAAVTLNATGPAAHMPKGTHVVSVGNGADVLRLTASDVVPEPDGAMGSYAAYHDFLARHERLAAIQRSPVVTYTAKDGATYQVRPKPLRPITSLPPDFWVQIVVGIVAWMISASIWAFRPRETSARYLLLSGFSTLMFSPFAAGLTTRELSQTSGWLEHLNDLNFLGGSLFAASLASLLLYYPKKIAPRWVGLSVVAISLGWYVAQQAGLFESMTMARRLLVIVLVAATFVLSAVQWRLTRRDPVARAALSWFLLSWVLGCSVFCLGVLLPQLFGVDTSWLQPYGFLTFLLVYFGLAFGIIRYRLFDLGVWWGRVMVWALGLMVFSLFDLAFVFGLGMSVERSLSLSLLACGLLWFPLRGWLWGRIGERKVDDGRDQFEQIVEAAFGRETERQAESWGRLLEQVFRPLSVAPATADQPRASLEDDGLALVTPSAGRMPSLRLEYAGGGRRLFTRDDQRRADQLAGMLRYVLESRDAYERGVTVERKRIAGDIHDNLGATLLSALHSDDSGRKNRYIRESLADLRSIVTAPPVDGQDLAGVLAGARKEMAERLEARGVQFVWDVELDDAGGLDSSAAQSLRAMLREITNNIVKHAGASRVVARITREAQVLVVSVEDDGAGFDPTAVAAGAGLSGLRERASRHGGEAVWSPGAGGRGTRVTVRLAA